MLTALTYFGLLALPTRHVFTVTTLVDRAPGRGDGGAGRAFPLCSRMGRGTNNQMRDSSGILPQDSLIGRMLHTLIGYTDRPTEPGDRLCDHARAMAALIRIAAPRGRRGSLAA
jgi:high-affinity iron transporter